MNNEKAFLVWAPPDVCWSDWAKPVAFAQAQPAAAPQSEPSGVSGWQTLPLDWLSAPRDAAVVVDLPGVLSIAYGLAMAQRGYRPVPLYNACSGPSEIVKMQQIVPALFTAARELQAMSIPEDAPPAFLLDADRLRGSADPRPGCFDNRWMVFPQDFPSGVFLTSQHIRRALLVRNGPPPPPDDLAHVLLRWQQANLEIMHQDVQTTDSAQPLRVQQPKQFRSLWYRLAVMAGLRGNSAGGFGSIIPVPTSGLG